MLYRLTDQVTDVLDLAGAGISVAELDRPLNFVTATDEVVVRIEEEQIESGEGPCHDAHDRGAQVWVDAREPRGWSAEELATAQLFADMATGYITNARALSASRELAGQLQHARSRNAKIHDVARGILDGTASLAIDEPARG